MAGSSTGGSVGSKKNKIVRRQRQTRQNEWREKDFRFSFLMKRRFFFLRCFFLFFSFGVCDVWFTSRTVYEDEDEDDDECPPPPPIDDDDEDDDASDSINIAGATAT